MSIIEFKCIRKHIRYQPNQDIDLFISEISTLSELKNIKAKLRDISESGMGVFSNKNVDADTEVMIDLFFGSTRITTSATVIYSKELEIGYAIGIKLTDNTTPIMQFIKAKDIQLNKV